jgi:glycerol kinase
MNTPIQTRPVARLVVWSSQETHEEIAGWSRDPRDSSAREAAGIVPLGYEQCYRLRGPAQDMCLSQYY